MTPDTIIDLSQQALYLIAMITAPMLLSALAIGLIIGMFQAATSINEQTLSFETIRQVCLGGEGHYLGTEQTLAVMQSEYIYPDCSDRDSPIAWEGKGRPELMERAIALRDEILATHYPNHISDELDQALREQFPIALDRNNMGRTDLG